MLPPSDRSGAVWRLCRYALADAFAAAGTTADGEQAHLSAVKRQQLTLQQVRCCLLCCGAITQQVLLTHVLNTLTGTTAWHSLLTGERQLATLYGRVLNSMSNTQLCNSCGTPC